MVESFSVVFSREAVDGLGHLDRQVAQRVLGRIKWLSIHIEDVNHKALTGHLRGEFKLRVGDYRVIYEIQYEGKMMTIRWIAHRSEIYHLK